MYIDIAIGGHLVGGFGGAIRNPPQTHIIREIVHSVACKIVHVPYWHGGAPNFVVFVVRYVGIQRDACCTSTCKHSEQIRVLSHECVS